MGANNRGNPITSLVFGDPARFREVLDDGDAFLLSHRLALASIQWEFDKVKGLPETAKGVGMAIVRDFGRLLGGGSKCQVRTQCALKNVSWLAFSQSAFFVNTLVAEGFNEDPVSHASLYHGVVTRNGSGNVLAIKKFADGTQFSYMRPDLASLKPAELLKCPSSDPEMIDVMSLTDFYRLNAGIFITAPPSAHLHRYWTIAAHAPAYVTSNEAVFHKLHCNGGHEIPLNAVSDAIYLRPPPTRTGVPYRGDRG